MIATMMCPIDNENLEMTERLGVQIEYCPQCRGVWLDRGELDKIIERVDAQVGGSDEEPERSSHQGNQGRDYPRRKRRSFLSELFD